MRGLPKRRRQEAKTDYGSRLTLLRSGKPRLVIRKTNKYIVAQLVNSTQAQDSVLFTVSSKDLLSKGWPADKSGSLKSLTAAYLTGFMFGVEAKKKAKSAILDMGMQRNIAGSRIYAVLKGALDAGFSVPHSEDVLPDEERINSNKSLSQISASVKKKLE